MMEVQTKPISWSFTALEHYKQCPKAYYEIRVLKNFKEEEGEALLWGNRVHTALAWALENKTPFMPQGMEIWEPMVQQFLQLKGDLKVEQQLALDEGFKPCKWFAKEAWVRGVVDALWVDGTVVKAVDWKTGKRKPKSDQLALFALLIFHHFPQVQEVRTMFVWLKTLEQDQAKYIRTDVPSLWQLFTPDLQRLKYAHQQGQWPPRSSGLCAKHCPVVTCSFNGRRRQEDW